MNVTQMLTIRYLHFTDPREDGANAEADAIERRATVLISFIFLLRNVGSVFSIISLMLCSLQKESTVGYLVVPGNGGGLIESKRRAGIKR